MSKKKPGVFDEAVLFLHSIAESVNEVPTNEGMVSNKQISAELRAAIAVLKACEKVAGEVVSSRDVQKLIQLVLRAGNIAERREP
jgi:hypothetical protein